MGVHSHIWDKKLTKPLTESSKLLTKIQEVLKEYELESNIPIDHQYWLWLNQYRGLLSEGK